MFGSFGFRGGITPQQQKKQTADLKIEPLATTPRVIISMIQHKGVPATPVVKHGDRVKVGQLIGEASGNFSCPVHASVSGKVLSVGAFPYPTGAQVTAVEIENNMFDDGADKIPFEKPWKEAAPGEIIQKICSCGIVGMGGGAFPTHVKLSPPSNKPIDTLIINGMESEPYATADHRLMVEHAEKILVGSLIIKKVLAAKTALIAVDRLNTAVIKCLTQLLNDAKFKDLTLVKLPAKYPQGSEKQLIYALTKRTVASSGSPIDVGCIVQNVATAFAVSEAICKGITLFERVVTVSGPAIRSPKNLLVRVGTPLRHILERCEVDIEKAHSIVMGGALTGTAQSDLDVAVLKSTTSIVVFSGINNNEKTYSCISCGRCVRACPMRLVPSRLAKYVNKNMIDEAGLWGVDDCFECGACSYVCPSKINLVHFMKLGKYWITKQKKSSELHTNHDR